MQIINKGSVKIRIEGYGYLYPGKKGTVPDNVGRQLCVEGSSVQEVKKPLPLPAKKQSFPKVKKPASKRTGRSRKKI